MSVEDRIRIVFRCKKCGYQKSESVRGDPGPAVEHHFADWPDQAARAERNAMAQACPECGAIDWDRSVEL